MADQFIGLTVFLTMTDPDRTQLRGLVADVICQELSLTNGLFPIRILPKLYFDMLPSLLSQDWLCHD
jgi:hypothetical protein